MAVGRFDLPCGVVVNGGEVFVTEVDNHRVQVFRLDGSFVRQLEQAMMQPDYPSGVTVSEGEVFVPLSNY